MFTSKQLQNVPLICFCVCLALAVSAFSVAEAESPTRPHRVRAVEHRSEGVQGQANDVSLLSPRGQRYVGNQLDSFAIDPDGVISTQKPAWIALYYTEGKPFRLRGEVWLGGSSEELLYPGDLPDGFALFLREWDGLQRYSFTSRRGRVKRRLYRGEKLSEIVDVSNWEGSELGEWIPFSVTANWDEIEYSFGGERITVEGPLDMDGANKIAIAPGTRLRNLQLGVFAP